MSTQLLGTGVDGTTPCALLSLADGSPLLLNASEGLQRLASEHQLRLHRALDAVLLTSVSPLAAAGLPGLLLTLAQKGAAAVHICGPPGTASLVRLGSGPTQPAAALTQNGCAYIGGSAYVGSLERLGSGLGQPAYVSAAAG